MSKPQIVLDAAGAILTNFSGSYWEELATLANLSTDTFTGLFSREIRQALWTGRMREDEFWDWLREQLPEIDVIVARELIAKHINLTPHARYLEEWCRLADLHLLSNHRHEWILDRITPITGFFHSITISSQVGLCKPESAIYEFVHAKLNGSCILFVDDQEKNLVPARKLGWSTVIADTEGNWTSKVSQFIHQGVMQDG